ncbi:hypothetical protein ABID99_004916 [Mucilaginibacter sp. OAE612]
MQKVMTSYGRPIAMKEIEQLLIKLLQSGQLVSVDDLGGLNAYHDLIDVVANSKMMDEFLKILLEDAKIFDQNTNSPLIQEIIIRCFTDNNDPIAIRNAIETLCTQPQKLAYTFDTLLNRAGDVSGQSMIRGYFLLGAFEIAVRNKAKRYRLIGYLIGIETTDNPEYLKYVAKITGVCYTDFQTEDLVDKLTEFVTAKVGEDDALYELGMCFLTKALNSETQTLAIINFDSAMRLFRRAGAYGRYDADVYTAAILTLKKFVDRENISELKVQVEALTRALSIYNAWDNYNQQIHWIGLRNTEIFYWYEMADYLTMLLEHFTTPAWLEPIVVIEKYMLKIYDCSRTIFKKVATGGLELLTRPIIQAKFIEQPEKVFLLEQWLQLSKDQEVAIIAQQLHADIEIYKSSWQSGNGEGAVSRSLADAVPSLAYLPAHALTEFDKFVVAYTADQTTDVSLILKKQFNDLTNGLKAVSTYSYPEIKKAFNTILFHSLRFLELRMDNTGANHSKAKYLFQTRTFPKEDVLQTDYFEYMQPVMLRGKIKVEEMNVAGGRADVYFEYLSFNFCTEVKREFKNTSFDALKIKYLGQAKEYQNTSAKVGILLVLDLLPKPNGIGSFESNIKLEIVSTAKDPEPRGIVVIKVPANRITPSAIVL